MTVTTLAYTGAVQTYTVPAGVTFVTLECWGAAGIGGQGGGLGGYSKGMLIVAPGTVLNVYVGATGGAFGGGGAGGGGGASDVRVGGTGLADRVIVAGGGGGAAGAGTSNYGAGGVGGGLVGGYSGGGFAGGTISMAGGTQTSGYALGQGGPGDAGYGGGGGGYYGGFGGHYASGSSGGGLGGGGGSGYLSPALVSASMTTGVRAGAGQVVITALNTSALAPTVTAPPANGYAIATEANTFTWAVNDADPGDYQTRADLRWKKSGDATWTTIASAATTAPTYTLPAGTWSVGFTYEYQISTYDNAGLQSPWSSSQFLNVIASIPAPTITVPIFASSQYGTPVNVEWTLPGVFTSDAYRVQRNSAADGTGIMYYDSGTVVTTGRTASIPLDPAAGRVDYLRVSFRYYGHWSPFGTTSILSEFGPPHIPLLTLAQVPGRPEVVVTITNPPGSAGYASTLVNDLYRTSPDGVKVRVAANLPPNALYVDKLAGAGTNTYTVTAFAISGATATSA